MTLLTDKYHSWKIPINISASVYVVHIMQEDCHVNIKIGLKAHEYNSYL